MPAVKSLDYYFNFGSYVNIVKKSLNLTPQK